MIQSQNFRKFSASDVCWSETEGIR